MPELPEVETTCRGIRPHVVGQFISAVIVRQPLLRWPVPAALGKELAGQTVQAVSRRAKYLLLHTERGTLIVHLGMSGSLRVTSPGEPWRKHDHVEVLLENGRCLRFHDPRRFGAMLWTDQPIEAHVLLRQLGPEPLESAFNAEYLYTATRNRRAPIKQVIMDQNVVVGVGNIYANEAIFLAAIHPKRAANRIAKSRFPVLVERIQQTLSAAIELGGSTLRDFVNGEGKPGYFQQTLHVYGRAGEPCPNCGEPIRVIKLGQRATYYCSRCQK